MSLLTQNASLCFMDSAHMHRCFQNHPHNILTKDDIEKIGEFMRNYGFYCTKREQAENYSNLTFLGGLNDMDCRNYGLSETAYQIYLALEQAQIIKRPQDCQLMSDWMAHMGYSFEHQKSKRLLSTTQGSSDFYWFQENNEKGHFKKVSSSLRSVLRQKGLSTLILH